MKEQSLKILEELGSQIEDFLKVYHNMEDTSPYSEDMAKYIDELTSLLYSYTELYKIIN